MHTSSRIIKMMIVAPHGRRRNSQRSRSLPPVVPGSLSSEVHSLTSHWKQVKTIVSLGKVTSTISTLSSPYFGLKTTTNQPNIKQTQIAFMKKNLIQLKKKKIRITKTNKKTQTNKQTNRKLWEKLQRVLLTLSTFSTLLPESFYHASSQRFPETPSPQR